MWGFCLVAFINRYFAVMILPFTTTAKTLWRPKYVLTVFPFTAFLIAAL